MVTPVSVTVLLLPETTTVVATAGVSVVRELPETVDVVPLLDAVTTTVPLIQAVTVEVTCWWVVAESVIVTGTVIVSAVGADELTLVETVEETWEDEVAVSVSVTVAGMLTVSVVYTDKLTVLVEAEFSVVETVEVVLAVGW